MLQKYSYHKISFTFTNGNKYNDKLKFTKERIEIYLFIKSNAILQRYS